MRPSGYVSDSLCCLFLPLVMYPFRSAACSPTRRPVRTDPPAVPMSDDRPLMLIVIFPGRVLLMVRADPPAAPTSNTPTAEVHPKTIFGPL